MRYQAARYLLERFDPDLLVVLFSQIDNGGHYFWRFHDLSHPDHHAQERARYGDILLNLYKQHETILKDLMERYPAATYLICSDHGMGFNYDGRYYLKELFTRLGWYVPTGQDGSNLNPRNLLSQTVNRLYWMIFRHVPMRYKRRLASRFPGLRSRVESIVSNVDWDRTRLYSNDDFFSIVINRTDSQGTPLYATHQEYLDFRDAIIARLTELEELRSGQRLVREVYTKEAIYSGAYLADAPDLIIEWEEVRSIQGLRCGELVIPSEEIHKSDLQAILSGEHRPEGMLLLVGDMIRKGARLEQGSILDIAPTILYLSGYPIPEMVDGKARVEAFKKSFREANPLTFTDQVRSLGGSEDFTFSAEETEEVRERLRSLGYIE
jgi:predicted AlkP superfamily phosphohydrolase/phosphomutase